MRLPALLAFAALAGLTACDSAKVSELTGAKPPAPQAAATQPTACPPAPNPACPSAVATAPSMAPEPAKTAPVVAAPTPKARRIAWAAPRAHHVRRTAGHRARAMARAPVRHNAYAGGYIAEAAPPHGRGRHDEAYAGRRYGRHYEHPPVYARPDEGYDRRAYAYERREEGSEQGGYRYERRESGHPPYVDDRAYRYERRDDAREGYRYERREEGYSSSRESLSSYSSDGADCNCRPQAAGRDRQGFLTWPGKQP